MSDDIDIECPKCAAPMVLRKSDYGPFLSCSTFPECRGKIRFKREFLEEAATLHSIEEVTGDMLEN